MNTVVQRWHCLLVFAVLLIVLAVACAPAPTPTSSGPTLPPPPPLPTATTAPKVLKIGIHLLATGPDSVGAKTIFDGAVLAIEQVNAKNAVPGYKFEAVMVDDTTATTGQADPAQAATNARKLIGDPLVIASVGPQFSGLNKATAPLYSEAGMVNISPSATNPDLTDPKFANQYRPAGKPGFMRVCSTDALQSPGIANYAFAQGWKKVYIIDDGDAFGVGTADAFEKRAKEKGMTVLGRDRVDPNAADYSTILTKVKALGPDAIFYGGHTLAGSKLAIQMKSTMPTVKGLSTDGIAGADFVQAAGDAGEGWLVTQAAPNLEAIPAAAQFVKDYTARFKTPPVAYSGGAYDAVNVIVAAVKKVAESGQPVTRANVRDAILALKDFAGVTGPLTFDANGDRVQKQITIWKTTKAKTEGIAYVAEAPQD